MKRMSTLYNQVYNPPPLVQLYKKQVTVLLDTSILSKDTFERCGQSRKNKSVQDILQQTLYQTEFKVEQGSVIF